MRHLDTLPRIFSIIVLGLIRITVSWTSADESTDPTIFIVFEI